MLCRASTSVVAACVAVALALALNAGCGDDGGHADVDGGADLPDLDDTVVGGFDDHTRARLDDLAAYEALAAAGVGRSVVKFVITEFSTQRRAIRYLDGNFYALHDEWYWFRLLNGETVPGVATVPASGLAFETVEEVRTWATTQPQLPLDLVIVGDGRLYSPAFYDFALRPKRAFGVGGLMWVPARTEPVVRPELWVFELEYVDAVTHAQLADFFDAVMASLPAELAAQLLWVVRSPQQETLARQMEAEHLQFYDRILRYSELAVPGEVEVYSEGLTAGRVKALQVSDPALGNTLSSELLLLDQVPDWLPPAAGLITAVPQTPLAHVNVLARNRGIPNAYLGGLLEDPSIDQLARVHAPAIVRAVFPDQLDIVAITEAEFRGWYELLGKRPVAVAPVEVNTLPYVYDLATLDAAEVEALRPAIGGKSAGFLGLMAPGGVSLPDQPLAISIRAYVEHLEALRPTLEAVLSEGSFALSPRTRFLVLEGPRDYDARYTTADDQSFEHSYLARYPAGTPVGDVLAAGGFKALLRATPMAPATVAAIESELAAHYGAYSPLQGLRFRSSSSVEDLEGFNGAGLYDSNTGFLQPQLQGDPGDRTKSVEWAIKKTWSSYWGAEAFEERQLEQIDHLSGNMGVLVHARFDDSKELNNGVFTFTVLPDGHAQRFVMELNAQQGAESVTNPTPGLNALPEVDRVSLADGGTTPTIERLRASTLAPPGTRVLDDEALRSLFVQARAVTEAWLARDNAAAPAEQRSQTLTLDFEFRGMAGAWPALASGPPYPARIVVKQARSLEPGLRHVPEPLLALPFPRDLLRRARSVERRSCVASRFRLTTVEALTEPLAAPDMGHAVDPFSSFVSLDVTVDLPELSLLRGHRFALSHLLFTATHPEMADGRWSLELVFDALAVPTTGIETLRLRSDGTWELTAGGASATGVYACTAEPLLTTPEAYLLALLASKTAP